MWFHTIPRFKNFDKCSKYLAQALSNLLANLFNSNQLCSAMTVFTRTKYSSLTLQNLKWKVRKRWFETIMRGYFRSRCFLLNSWLTSAKLIRLTESLLVQPVSIFFWQPIRGEKKLNRLEGFGSENLKTCWTPATGAASDAVRLVNLNSSPRQEPPGQDNTETIVFASKAWTRYWNAQPGADNQLGRMKPLAGSLIHRLIPGCDLGLQSFYCITLRSLSTSFSCKLKDNNKTKQNKMYPASI